MANDLQIHVDQQIGLLNWNFEELNRALDIHLEKYNNLVFDEKQMPEAKQTRAMLNKLKKAIDDKRKDVKKEFCQPYDAFADQVKELTAKIDSVNNKIDAQIKNQENAVKQAKKAQIEEWWKTHGSSLAEFEKVFDERYLNTTYTEKEWQEDLSKKRDQLNQTLQVIGEFEDEEKKKFILADYIQTLDLNKSIENWAKYKEATGKIEENKVVSKVQEKEVVNPEKEEEIIKRTFMVQGTREQIVALGDFMKSHNIKFWKIETEEKQ